MIRKLPGSSDAASIDIYRLQKQCDWVRADDQIKSKDQQDEETLARLILEIPNGDANPTNKLPPHRFSNPKLIGFGAFGLVFSCADSEQGGKRVALKILRPSRQADRIARERFQEEFRLMAGFKHPSIVRILGTGEIDHLPYLVAEYADAGSLAALIHDHSVSFSPRQAAWLVARIAEAVEEAHSTPILHRDIKPGNILLRTESPERTEGLGLWPLLTDFGLSKDLSVPSGMTLTFEGEVLGTLSYMSPEQVLGQPFKIQSDLFPLGIILYELVYRQHPFRADSDFQTRNKIVQAIPTRTNRDSRRVPAALDAIISKCLRRKPEERYLHASDLARDLDSFLNGEPISVSTPTPWQALVQLIAHYPLPASLLATIFICMVAFILMLSREWQIQRNLAQTSQSLADDREKISQLFLQSMRATNSGINDTILASERVRPSALLATLDTQIPLLEKALELAPKDGALIRQLQIMYHYKSLCHIDEMNSAAHPVLEMQRMKAIEARKKSLEYIDFLIQHKPSDENLSVAKINGLYNLSCIVNHPNERAYRVDIQTKAFEVADEFLKLHPGHRNVLETKMKLKFNWANDALKDKPEERARVLQEIAEMNLRLFRDNPSRVSLLFHALESLTMRGCLLLKMNRSKEACIDFESFDRELRLHEDLLLQNWGSNEVLCMHFIDRCEALLTAKRFKEVVSSAALWGDVISRQEFPKYSDIFSRRFYHRESVMLFPEYYEWAALFLDDPESEEVRHSRKRLMDRVMDCQSTFPAELESFLWVIEARSHSDSITAKMLLDQSSDLFSSQ